MAAHRLTSPAGFVLLAAMIALVVMEVMATVAAQQWRTIMLRDREEELLFRGTQFQNAIARWHNPKNLGPGQPKPPPRPLWSLKDLLQDPNSLETIKYLRRIYTDPITNGDFKELRDPVNGITGVYSSSDDPPLKRGNFPVALQTFTDKDKYSDWQFDYRGIAAGGKLTVTTGGIPGTPKQP